MAKFQSKAFTGQRPIPLPDDAYGIWTVVDIEYPVATPVINDLLEACELPIGVKCLDWYFVSPDVDSGGATLAFSLGTENAGGTDLGTEVWGTGIAAAGNGVPTRNALAVCAQGDITANRKIALKVTANATTYAGLNKTAQLALLLQA